MSLASDIAAIAKQEEHLRFKSFSEAARENADSRVKAGLHFRSATTAGLKLGESVGRFAVRYSLTPLD